MGICAVHRTRGHSLCNAAVWLFRNHFLLAGPVAWLLAISVTSAAEAGVRAQIDLSAQVMTVSVDGWRHGSWRVSTARPGYRTPVGTFRPYLLKRMHYSSKYENSPMPHSVFFLGGYAVHGTGYIKSLGRPVSHGCI